MADRLATAMAVHIHMHPAPTMMNTEGTRDTGPYNPNKDRMSSAILARLESLRKDREGSLRVRPRIEPSH